MPLKMMRACSLCCLAVVAAHPPSPALSLSSWKGKVGAGSTSGREGEAALYPFLVLSLSLCLPWPKFPHP